MSTSDIILGLIAVLFPPVAVWIKCGFCSLASLLNIILLFLGYLPGLLHAWYIIARYPDSEYEAIPPDAEIGRVQPGERVTYYYVSAPGAHGYGTNGGVRAQAQPKTNAQAGQQQQQYQDTASRPAQSEAVNEGEAGASTGAGNKAVPPSYDEAVQGDHKIQT